MARSIVSGVYRIHCGPYFYVGSSSDIAKRRQHHHWRLRNGIHHCAKLQAAFLATDQIKIETIRRTEDPAQLKVLEQEILDFYKDDPMLCNSSLCATGPDERMKNEMRSRMACPSRSAATRARMADAKRGANNCKSRSVIVTIDQTDREFPSVTDAAKFLGVSQQAMHAWMNGITAWPGTGNKPCKRRHAHLAECSAKFSTCDK